MQVFSLCKIQMTNQIPQLYPWLIGILAQCKKENKMNQQLFKLTSILMNILSISKVFSQNYIICQPKKLTI